MITKNQIEKWIFNQRFLYKKGLLSLNKIKLLEKEGFQWYPYGYNFLPFEEAKLVIKSLNFKSQDEWKKYCQSGKRPTNIPSHPEYVYKNCGWISLGDWIGTNNIAPQNKKFLSFEEAKKIIHRLRLKSQKEWFQYRKSNNRPVNIPSNPNVIYKSTWISLNDWLGKTK